MRTDFAGQQPEINRAWGHEAYRAFQDQFFFKNWLGSGDSAIVEHVKDVRRNDMGMASAMIHLIADVFGGGIVDDNELDGRERELNAYWQEINISQLRNGFINKGRLADQKSVIEFRGTAKDKGGRWLADSLEEQMMLTASGISYAFNLNGSARTTPAGQDDWTSLAYASDVTAPSTNRHFRWDATTGLEAGDTTAVAAVDTLKYDAIVDILAEAQSRRVKPIKRGGKDYFVLLVHPRTLAQLRKDTAFRESIIQADVRGDDNKIFTGAQVTMHGVIVHSFNKVFNTTGAASSAKWGAAGAIDGTRSLLLGAQALAFADLGTPYWDEEGKDYGNRQGISIGKMGGILKPRFHSVYDNSTEDFGLMALDHAI